MGMVCAHLHRYTYPHMSAPGLPTLGFLGSRCKAIHADTSTTYPVTACLCAIPASKWCLYHLGLPWYTCVTCPQSLEAPECPEPSSRWQETLPGPASSLGPQNDPPLHPPQALPARTQRPPDVLVSLDADRAHRGVWRIPTRSQQQHWPPAPFPVPSDALIVPYPCWASKATGT